MTATKRETSYRPGIPMSEEELSEWKKTFTDIQESIDNLSVDNLEDENNGRNVRQNSRKNCEKDN